MARYALLLRASTNRVYGAAALALARAELGMLARHVSGLRVDGDEQTVFGGVDYWVIETCAPLDHASLAVLSNLSSLHALFEVDEGGRFVPVTIAPTRVLDEDLVTIQRYPGKTNEAFTHLLVNVALGATPSAFERLRVGPRLRLLDPLCGRGTSLNRAALYGMDAAGVEIDQRDVDAHAVFFGTWLKDKRLKHTIERARLRKGRLVPAHRVTFTYGVGKDRSTHRTVDVVHGDTIESAAFFRASSFDLLVCDLPYGVQHGARPAVDALDRSPEGLLAAALPIWAALLKPGAGVALAWNRRTLPRHRLATLVVDAGLEVERPDDEAFVHRVDRSITRDVLVAARPLR